jgi:hypothetical protein
MFCTAARKGSGCVLRRTWYLTEGARVELRSRWIVDDLSPPTPNPDMSRNAAVTMAWDTEPTAECA